ncbi:hypothetical protein DB347_11290 [Opitutaceae bacterium EW11]|nr:hypothetical protein DB347_11290 [Opitutaceae bacterium EW11]
MFLTNLVKNSLRTFFGMALLAGAAFAESNPPMPAALPEDLLPDLKRILEAAVKQSPTMLARNLDVAQAEANYIMDRAPMLPSIAGSGSYSKSETRLDTPGSFPTKSDSFSYGLSASQPVFQWGALKYQRDISKLQVAIAAKQYAEVYRTLAVNIRAQYLALIQKKLVLRNTRFAQQMAESNLAIQEARLRDGRISSGDIINPRLAVDEARIYSDRAEADYDQSRRLLALSAGVGEITDEMVPSSIPKPVYAAQTLAAYFDSFRADDFENTLMAGVYRDTIRQGELRYRVARARLLPKINLSASYNYGNQSNLAQDGTGKLTIVQSATTSKYYGVYGYWTLFDGLATRGAKLSALAAKRLAEQNLESYKKTLSEQVRGLEKQIGFSGRLMDLTEIRLALAQDGVKKVAGDVNNGVTPQSTLDSFTQMANKAELDSVVARADFLSRWSDYVSTLGVDPALQNLPARYFRNGK